MYFANSVGLLKLYVMIDLLWDKSNRAMKNTGELKFWQLQNSPEKKEKKARSLTSVRVTSLPTW